MKICIASAEARHAEPIQSHLNAGDKRHVVTCIAGTQMNLQNAYAGDPDLVVFAESAVTDATLAEIDALTGRHPNVQMVLACDQQAPEFLRAAMRAGVREVLPLAPSRAALDEAIVALERKAL